MNIKLYENLLSSMSDCIVIYKAVDHGEDFKFIEFNKAAENLEHISRETLIGRNVTEVFPEIKDIGLFKIFQDVYKTGKSCNHLFTLYENDKIYGYRENNISKLDDNHLMSVYSDISKEKEAENKLEKTLSFLKSHQEVMDVSNIVTKSDLKGNITYANNNFYQITGFSEEEVIGKSHNIVRHKDNPKSLYKEMWKTIQSKKIYKKIIKNKGNLGDYLVELIILPILDENKEIVEYIGVRHNITETIKQKEKLDNLANTDSLTGLGSRYKLLQDIESSISPVIAVINIDGFSQINDFYGHKIGDDVLKQFSDNLSNLCLKKYSSIYHLQGDEFVILDTNTKKYSFLKKITDIHTRLNNINILINSEDTNVNFTTAISFEAKENILQTADMALTIAIINQT
ncbi:MAG: diguanylate cyclase (GGDEF)-like protein/PAS domain S-box-containing protein [Arcobacteraceae bacterium]|jgi:diguanylate cyclase (GGDEF)-like protein/PAS domain S-box-containing protein